MDATQHQQASKGLGTLFAESHCEVDYHREDVFKLQKSGYCRLIYRVGISFLYLCPCSFSLLSALLLLNGSEFACFGGCLGSIACFKLLVNPFEMGFYRVFRDSHQSGNFLVGAAFTDEFYQVGFSRC